MTQSILISGASTGIGFATALHFSKKGYHVFAGIRKDKDAELLLQGSKNHDGKIEPLTLDVTKEADILNVFSKIKLSGFPLNALINNAGIVVAGPVEALPINKIKEQFDVNVFGLVALTQKMIPLLRMTKGRIVNVSSIAGKTVTPMIGAYCASKHAVEAFSDALRMELAHAGIKVIVIEPGSIATPIWDKSEKSYIDELALISPEIISHYQSLISGIGHLTKLAVKNASPVELVVSSIDYAIESSRPKTRYLVGKDAKLSMIQNILPDKLLDRVVLGYINKYGHN